MVMYSKVSPEVHVEGEVHELVADFPHVEDVERNSHGDRWTTVVRSYTSVVANLPRVQFILIFTSMENLIPENSSARPRYREFRR